MAHHAIAPPAAVPLSGVHVFGDRPAPFALDARSVLLEDAKSGTVLYSFNEHDRMQPASLAKIMTFYLTLDALNQKRIALDTMMPVSEAAWRLSMDDTVSRMFVQVGDKVAVKDLLYGLMVSSGNDAAVVLAEYQGGSTEAFTRQMNAKAQELGLTETHFTNPDGLPTSDEYTTAADMVKLGRALLVKHPEAITYTSAKEFSFTLKRPQPNFNHLLFHDSRVNGIKTGHVDEAGYHLVASANSNGLDLVSAVMGTTSEIKRQDETEKLLDWAFRTFATAQPDVHKVMPPTMPVFYGTADTVPIAPARELFVTVDRGSEGKIQAAWRPAERYLNAPVANGTEVGQLLINQGSTQIDSIPVITTASVGKGGFFKRLGDHFRRAH